MWTFQNIVLNLVSLKVGSSVYATELSGIVGFGHSSAQTPQWMATSASVAQWRQAATSVSEHLGNNYSMRDRISGLSQKMQFLVQVYI